ncbi:uncharacterized protein LOC120335298 [Styela clava]
MLGKVDESLKSMCHEIWRPFYGWIENFFKKVAGGVFHSFYDHGMEWLYFFSSLCTIINLPLDIYISYLYFYRKFNFFYPQELNIELSFAGMTFASSVFTVFFMWTTGKTLLIITEKENACRAEFGNVKSNQISPQDSYYDHVQDTEDGESSTTDKGTEISDESSTKFKSNCKSTHWHVFPCFKMFIECMFMISVGPAQLYLIYSYVVQCSAIVEPGITAKLIIAGIFLPILLTVISWKAIYITLSKPWSTHCIKPLLVLLSLTTIIAGAGSVWFAAFSFNAMHCVTKITPAVGLEYKQNDTTTPAILLHTRSNSYYVVGVKNILTQVDLSLDVHFECSKKHAKMGLKCEEISFTFQYHPENYSITYEYTKRDEDGRVSTNELPGRLGWACNLCHLGEVLRKNDQGTVEKPPKSSKDSNIGLPHCATIPQWLYYFLTGYTFLIIIIFLLIITQAVMVKHKEEHRQVRRLSSKIADLSDFPLPQSFVTPATSGNSYRKKEVTPLPGLKRMVKTKLHGSHLKEIERAATRQEKKAKVTYSHLTRLSTPNNVPAAIPRTPRIIRVPKGTAMNLVRRETK